MAETSNHTDLDNSERCFEDDENENGHFFIRKTFHKPVYCHHCTDMLWGLIGQGYVCEVCNFVVHDKCLGAVVSPCSSIAPMVVKNPVSHCWSEPGHFKRKFCNSCRKRLEDSWAIRCEICEYYAHLECQEFVVSDCKEAATYSTNTDKVFPIQYHMWREGNLPGNSKCLACKKTCWSSECLTGMRCEWCGATAHAGCYKQLPLECSFGCLREIMLPPSCITAPDMSVAMETIYRFQKKPITALPVTEDLSSTDSRTEEEERRSPKEKEAKDRDKEEEIVRIFDGNDSLRRRVYRTVAIPKNAPAQVLLEAAVRTFHISEDPKKYYLTEIHESESGGEKEIDTCLPVRGQICSKDCKRSAIFLRYRENSQDHQTIKVYSGKIRHLTGAATAHKHLQVTADTTVRDVIHSALRSFGLQGQETHDFQLLQMSLDSGVVEERLMTDDELPWHVVLTTSRESIRQYHLTRFYVKPKDDLPDALEPLRYPLGGNLLTATRMPETTPSGASAAVSSPAAPVRVRRDLPHIAVYVGNLPTGLSQKQYEKIMLDIIGRENKWARFDVIYYEYGAVVFIYHSAAKVRNVLRILGSSSFDDKQQFVLVLPHLEPERIPEYVTPLLVLVNVKSGGQQGQELIRSFRKLLNPHQVYDLMNGGPLPGLYVFRNIPYFRIMVCGGDGTVGWALSCLDNVGQDAKCSSPPMAIVPLGTGNDLARVLRWGPGYSGAEDPLNLLRDVIDAEEIKLDRWTVIFHPNEKEQDETKVAIANDTNAANTNEDASSIFVMNNYFGIGIDAELALDFHNAREENPDKFNSRLHNKSVYFKVGLRKMLNRRSNKDLHRLIRLEVDGKLVELPPLEGIIVLNILSWASGANPWGPEKEDQFAKPTHYDGMLEVVGVNGAFHVGQISSGMRNAMRIAQGGHLRITMLTDLAVQVDGEPWTQPAGQVVVLRSALKATMLKKSKNKIKRRNTEPNIYFPNEAPGANPQSPSGDGESCPS